MNAERSIQMAHEALQADEPASASALFESAARELAGSDRRQAAHLFLLASSHAAAAREDSLTGEAQHIYELEGDDEKIAEVALLRAAIAMRIGAAGRAWNFYIVCAKHTSMRLAQILAADPASELPGSITPTMELLFDQLAHCRGKLSELQER
jgi:hypothetical protein